MTNKLKQFILNYDMQKLVKSSQYYKEFMQSDEIVELQKKIDNEIDSIQKEWDVFIDIYKTLDTNKDEFTLEGKAKRDLAKQEQQKIVENELEKNQVMEEFREKLEMLRMNLKVYDNKEE
ncbi:hypothetical protein N5T66_04885 [Aliarcobacter cryaerophilus]|uniref:hypothetical protein n=1 Tax=Aliarcobacter cryaerophilus TaxID=28198 RepID=UPI0021B19BC4|nr:hypothetical protein [Aliarcobacter cryaerophilus]MCT7432608.1 hypothetical protein [Aliarcobacter cryaerophilus]